MTLPRLTGKQADAFLAGAKIEMKDGDKVSIVFMGPLLKADDYGALIYRRHYDQDYPKGEQYAFCTRGPDDPVEACERCAAGKTPQVRGGIPVWDVELNRARVLDLSWWFIRKYEGATFVDAPPDENWYILTRTKTSNMTDFVLTAKGAISKDVLTAIKAHGALSLNDIEAELTRGSDHPHSYDRHSPDGPPPPGEDDMPF